MKLGNILFYTLSFIIYVVVYLISLELITYGGSIIGGIFVLTVFPITSRNFLMGAIGGFIIEFIWILILLKLINQSLFKEKTKNIIVLLAIFILFPSTVYFRPDDAEKLGIEINELSDCNQFSIKLLKGRDYCILDLIYYTSDSRSIDENIKICSEIKSEELKEECLILERGSIFK